MTEANDVTLLKAGYKRIGKQGNAVLWECHETGEVVTQTEALRRMSE